MESLISIERGIVTLDEAEIKQAVKERCDAIALQCVSPDTIVGTESMRKEISKFLRDISKEFDRARAMATAKIDEQERYVKSLLEPLKEANDEFDSRIKEAKSTKFRETLKSQYFMPMFGNGDENGELVDFDEIYDPAWEKLSYAKAYSLMIATVKKRASEHDRYDIVVSISHIPEKVWSEIESNLIKSRSVYEIITKEKVK